MIRETMIAMMHTHCLPQTFWPFAATAAAFTKNLLPNIKNRIPYHIFYGKDPWKPFSMLWTFGCLAWVNIPKAKHKKLDKPAIPTIFVRYDKEHKGWRFLVPSHNLLIFWSNSARFLQDKSWNDCTDTIPIQDTDALHYNSPADVEDLGYDAVDEHDEELQQPLDDIYCLPPEPDMPFEGDSSPLKPTGATFEYQDDMTNNGSGSTSLTALSNRASDGSMENEHRATTPLASPLPLRDIATHAQDSAFSELSSMQNV
ncbi:uncharacterized protein UHOD_11256 [Ustilago sp. UG-2017b]|nr:uncharacterized protein UHOD_11256 [Ustilago sp. UG-2017b]